jgi:hypothetical protein
MTVATHEIAISNNDDKKRATCHECGVKEGQLHLLGCDMEYCPFCGDQLISCGHGAMPEDILEDKGRIPYIRYPNLCVKCGTLWPEMFEVPDEDWARYVQPNMRNKMLCKACYAQIKQWIDAEDEV